LPVSVKGIVFEGNNVWLRKNERDEWELPGGKMEKGEQPQDTVIRELKEELGFDTEVIRVVSADLYRISVSVDESKGVLVICYLCKLLGKTGDFEIIGEAGVAEFKMFPVAEISQVRMPDFYKDAIRKALKVAD